MSTRIKCCIIGIPDHQGVIHVGGRIGAAGGPEAFRRIFSSFRSHRDIHPLIQDLGNVGGLTQNLSQNHRNAADLIREGHRIAGLSVVIGGSHDHGFSHLLGISEALSRRASASRQKLKLGCINLDAHLDVRKPAPLISSGSPFYLALESGILDPKRFVEFGIQSHCNSAELWTYLKAKKVQVIPFQLLRRGKAIPLFKKTLKKLATACDAVVISFDLDSVASAFAPGVSAPQAEGFSSSEIIEIMEIAGSEKKVSSLGIFELNPIHDLDSRTARLAATAAYHFIMASS